MRYKALALSFLLLLPLLPIALANQPDPQPWNVEFRIRPGATKFWGPCVVSTVFPVDVYLWNDATLTGKGVYAFDFYVYWQNTAGISLKTLALHIPWPTGKYFLVKNETGTSGVYDFYHMAITAIGNSTLEPALELGATGLFNASVVTLNFHIDKEPCWPDNKYADFLIGNELGGEPTGLVTTYWPHVSTGCTEIITNIEIDQGTYDLYSSQPNMDPLVAANDPGRVNDHIFKESAIGETHVITIALSNITNAFGFGFRLVWDPSWYDTDIQKVTILPAFAPPYESLTIYMFEDQGYLEFDLMKPCEKPTVCAKGYLPVVTISFVTTNKPEIGKIPYAVNTTFAVTQGHLWAKCPDPKGYYLATTHNPTDLWYSGDITQMFVPKSLADLTIDGVVDVADLAAIAKKYGMASPYADLVAPLGGNVDIFDIVFVAKRYLDP